MPKTDHATLQYEAEAKAAGYPTVAGIDEAGRGPWAGPVVAAAVVLPDKDIPLGLADSKALKPSQRDLLFTAITQNCSVGIGIADVEQIDRQNILHATLWAMRQALLNLPEQPAMALVDGNKAPDLPCTAQTIVRGDALSLSIAAASIIAKVTRDRMMQELAEQVPGYGFERHKGYGTKQHQ
ncbi:MAG: ribonuclease HII, partial [Pseudomonadota bacterium]